MTDYHICLNLDNQLLQIVNALTTITEIRDPYTSNHQKRVARLAGAISGEMSLSPRRITGIYLAGLLHDIGKIYVPNEILTRPGRINEYEFNIIKKHCEVGYEILNNIKFPWQINDFVIQHHERLNGSGYPFGLTEEKIFTESKILAVADVVESISSHRPYRPALGINYALNEIKKNKGTLYDSKAVDACIRVCENKLFDFENNSNILKLDKISGMD